MVDAIVSFLLTELQTLIEDEIKLVFGVNKEIRNLETTFQSIQALLSDADRKQVSDDSVKLWLQRLKNIIYEMDDVLSEWSTAILKLRIEQLDYNNNNNNNQAASSSSSSSSSSNHSYKSRTDKRTVFVTGLNQTTTMVWPFNTLSCFSINRVAKRRDIANQIRSISAKLDLIFQDKVRYQLNLNVDFGAGVGQPTSARTRTTSAVEVSKVCGRDKAKSSVVSKLCEGSSENLHIVSIVGMGGIGKTTLAQLVYDCDELVPHFTTKMWVCVSENFDEVRVAKAIVEEVEGAPPNCVEYQMALVKLKNAIGGKKFLLVLDDVWSDDYRRWEPLIITLKHGAPGSKILVTTRNERVAMIMGAGYSNIRLGVLSEEDCWSLFHQIAFSERSAQECQELEYLGMRIASKCKGLPLAAKTIASLLRFKNSQKDWKNVLDSEIWQMGAAEKGLFPPLLLSYYYLPSAVKRCFSYCATIPKDCKIEAENLIKIWMAQGYLSSKEMEVTGREYLDTLIMGSFFQDLEKDKDSDVIVRFKMHDMVHDFARYLTKNECYIMDPYGGTEQVVESTLQSVRHLTIVRRDESRLPVPPNNTERLHTFWVQSFYDSPPIVIRNIIAPTDLFHHLKFVKVLDLSRNRLTKLPEEADKLMNLRYLNLSHNPLFELPETICGLYNLQTLKLVACDHLAKLPSRMEKLINLRHLEIDRTESLRALPKGIGKLTSLRTLSKFVIFNGDDNEEASCKLGDLRFLKDLRGSIKIEGIGHVTDVAEAKKTDLRKKEHLVDLQLDFSIPIPPEMASEMAEALDMHPNLQNLQMKWYGGLTFPNWILSLTSLRKLRLVECGNCTKLPPLGKLPSLETLYIESFQKLVRIDHEFLAVGSLPSFVAFPKLKKLKFTHMRSWEEWDMKGAEGKVEGIMPRLRYLKLSHCDKLMMLPEPVLKIAQLKKLRVHDCGILRQRYQKDTGEDWSRISHISNFRVL